MDKELGDCPGMETDRFKLFSDALSEHGFLLLGPKDCLHSPVLEAMFEIVDEKSRIYRKK